MESPDEISRLVCLLLEEARRGDKTIKKLSGLSIHPQRVFHTSFGYREERREIVSKTTPKMVECEKLRRCVNNRTSEKRPLSFFEQKYGRRSLWILERELRK